ncbi:hypothetical protein CBR_g65298, partial [Chara braunii]
RVPQHVCHLVGKFLRVLSAYALYYFLASTNTPAGITVFYSLVGSTALFLLFQQPWRGHRPLTKDQLTSSVINGGVLALGLLLWVMGLKACGPVRSIMAEYVGVVAGATSGIFRGRKAKRGSKVINKN